MKRLFFIIVVILIFLGTCFVSFARKRSGSRSGGYDPYGALDITGVCPTHGLMLQGLTSSSISAASDGGVFVLRGDRLMKFDKDLKLENEIEVPIDIKGVQRLLDAIDKCPACNAIMQGETSVTDDSDQQFHWWKRKERK